MEAIPRKILGGLLARAKDYAAFNMRRFGNMPPAMFASTPEGELWYAPKSLTDALAKNDFANAARLKCVAYAAQAAVMALEPWVS